MTLAEWCSFTVLVVLVVAFQYRLIVVLVMEWILIGVYIMLIAVDIGRIAVVLQLHDVALTASVSSMWHGWWSGWPLLFCNRDDHAFIKLLITIAAAIDIPKYRSPLHRKYPTMYPCVAKPSFNLSPPSVIPSFICPLPSVWGGRKIYSLPRNSSGLLISVINFYLPIIVGL